MQFYRESKISEVCKLWGRRNRCSPDCDNEQPLNVSMAMISQELFLCSLNLLHGKHTTVQGMGMTAQGTPTLVQLYLRI